MTTPVPDPVDPDLLAAWLSGWAVARGAPAPVRVEGGLRVDTGSAKECVRTVLFAFDPDRIAALVRTERRPVTALKVLARTDARRPHLPPAWRLADPRHLMISPLSPGTAPLPAALPDGHVLAVRRAGPVVSAEVRDEAGRVVAGGTAALAPPHVVIDDVGTAPGHRRRGLGRAIMEALRDAASAAGAETGLLVATSDGQALHATLGWHAVAPLGLRRDPGLTLTEMRKALLPSPYAATR